MSDGLESLPLPVLLTMTALPVAMIVSSCSMMFGEMTSQSKPSTITVASKDVVNGSTLVATSSDSAPVARQYVIATSTVRWHFRQAVDVARVLEPGCTYNIQSYQRGTIPFISARFWNIESAVHVPTPACPTNGARPARTPSR